ncbi:MAG: YciI family protein [Cytophagaceae bacterium]|nr:YciI family protein [Cytophagaceae bacterium]
MPQYLLQATDYTDAQALERRLAVRPAHLEVARKLKTDGHLLIGGAVLNEEGAMIGSMMVLDFSDETQLQDWLRQDPYLTGKVWDKIEIRPFRVANV